jgi:hypothetical protein
MAQRHPKVDPFDIIDGDKLLAAIDHVDSGVASLVVMSHDESSHSTIMLGAGDPLPDSACGWSVRAVAIFTMAQAHRFPADKVAQTKGVDTLLVELLADRTVARIAPPNDGVAIVDGDGFPVHPNVVMHGQVCAIDTGGGHLEIAHVSDVDAVGCSSVTLLPDSDDRSKHPRLADGRRIAAIVCDGLAPQLLRFLAPRRSPTTVAHRIVRMPTAMSNFLPNTPTKRENLQRLSRPTKRSFDQICADICAERRPVSLTVMLDDESMRLAAASHRRRRRQSGLQLQIPYPAQATNRDELQAAVDGLLRHFDTDYLLTFDAVVVTLAEAAMRGRSEGVLLDDALIRRVVELRFGSTNKASKAQRERVDTHFAMLRQVRVVVAPDGSETAFRGSILVKVGEIIVPDGTVEPLKVGDAIQLNPVLYGEIAKGKGIFADARYLMLNPCHEDWHLRLYRTLAHRWSAGSARLAEGGWTVRQSLHALLDSAGIDWRTKAHGQDRGELQARRRLDGALADLQGQGMVGAWRIEGEGMAANATLVVEVPTYMRDEIAKRRPGLHAAAAEGKVKPRPKRLAKA